MKVATSAYLRAVDANAVKRYGMRSITLMENAGRGCAQIILRELRRHGKRVAVVAGKGDNGGDGFVIARHLKNSGVDVSAVLLAGENELKGDSLVNYRTWRKMGGATATVTTARELRDEATALKHAGVIVDAIFGTGLSQPVRGIYAEVIGFINGLDKKVVSVDVPSGIDATTGAVLGIAVKAAVTATMAMPKAGLYIYPGRDHAGRIEVVDIGVPKALLEDEKNRCFVTTDEDLRRVLKPRSSDTHKGTYGHVLVLGGSTGKTGAAYMSAMGAMRAGAGLATIGLPASLNAVMEAKTTEVMTAPLQQTPDGTLGGASFAGAKKLMEGKSAAVMGPGMGVSDDVAAFVEKLVKEARDMPVVIDADGLNSIAGRLGMLKKRRAGAVLTPHPGEAARLLGMSASSVQSDRVAAAKKISEKSGSVVVLKGAATVIAGPGGEVYINPTGNAGLATAGTGDVLSGMIGGLLSQGLSALDAAVCAVYIHGACADEIKKANAGDAGMMATDLLALIPRVLNSCTASRGR